MNTPNKNILKTITLFDYYGTLTEDEQEEKISSLTSKQEKSEREIDIEVSEVVLGEGGMGIVFEGTQKSPKRNVAIKRIKKRNAYLEDLLQHEAMITGRLSHPNIIPIHILKTEGNYGPEVIMPLLKGNTLQNKLDTDTISLRSALFVLDQICNALCYAHANGVIHRDIKPENIMLGNYGDVYLVDWGIALDTLQPLEKNPKLVGTPSFMPPEMAKGGIDTVDERTDIYLLGATLHYILVKEPRHKGTNLESVLEHAKESPPFFYPHHIFSELGQLANQCCQADKEKRIQRVNIFQDALKEAIKHWDVMELILEAETLLVQLKSKTTTESALPLFLQARALFTQAQKSWPEAKTTENGLEKALEYMICIFLENGEYKTAKPICTEYESSFPHSNRIEKFRIRIDELEKSALEREKKANDNDLSITKNVRVRIAQYLVCMSFIAVGYVYWQIVVQKVENNYDMLLWTMLIPTLVIILLLPAVSKRLLYNQASRSAFITIFSTMVVSVLNRVIGILYEHDINSILTMDLFLMAMYWAHMTTQIRNAGIILMGTICCGFWCIWDPTSAFWMMNIGALMTSNALAYFWARGDL